jgi:hypothetical protein
MALGILIDEVQYLPPKELASLIVACHEVAQRNLPMFFVGAGLAEVATLAGNAKSWRFSDSSRRITRQGRAGTGRHFSGNYRASLTHASGPTGIE